MKRLSMCGKFGWETYQQISNGQMDEHQIDAKIATVMTSDEFEEDGSVTTSWDDQ